MDRIELDVKFLTPSSVRGYSNESLNNLRMQSFKGILRFWFRAVNYNSSENTKALYRKESDLFGSTKGKSKIFLSASLRGSNPYTINSSGLDYLKGQRDIKFNIDAYGTITILLPKNLVDKLKPTLQAFSLFGCIGARSRKGFGSLQVNEILHNEKSIWKIEDTDELKKHIREFLSNYKISEQPSYSAFSTNSVAYVYSDDLTSTELLSYVGDQLQLYRSWGSNGKVNSKVAHQNFPGDHDDMQNLPTKPKSHPKRVVFGLPHNYFFSTQRRKNVDIIPSSLNRRASPLFLKCHQYGGEATLVALILEAEFLPNGEKVNIKSHSDQFDENYDPDVSYQVIYDFFEGVNDRIYLEGAERIKGVS